MAADRKISRQASKRSASGSPIATKHINDQGLQCAGNIGDDHDFLAPNEIGLNPIGLLFCLTTKRLISLSFSTLYHRSQNKGWMDLLLRERRNLKPNVNSIKKCFMLNRLIAAYAENPVEFARQTTQLYEEIKMRMSSTVTSFSTVESLFDEIQACRNLLCQRRLFYINHDEAKQPKTLLSLQRATTKVCSRFINSCEKNISFLLTEERNHLKKLLQHSFIIVVQPSIPECVAATKYEKNGNSYTAKLNSRILCLLDIDKIEAHFIFSTIGVTLYSMDRLLGEEGQTQSVLEWKTRTIADAKGLPKLFYYAELNSIKLTKSDLRNSRALHSSKLCQLEFQLKIRMKNFNIEEDLTFRSRPFGLCSHAQYFPDYVAKVLIYEIEQIPQIIDHVIQPNIVSDFICRYHTRITGIEPKLHTRQFILQELQTVYEAKKNHKNFTSIDIYEEILAKLINQMEFFVDHPFLSMMYYDNLFLGICNSEVDNEMNGTREQLHILLRFSTLAEHQSSQQASVRYIVHDGHLIKATFHTKAFVDEMCRMICESNSEKAKTCRILSDIPNRSFHDFSLYFDNELFRLSTISPPTKEAYKPLIPVLWATMRATNDNQIKQLSSPSSSDAESTTLSVSSISQTENNLSNMNGTSDCPTILNEKLTIQTDKFIDYLAENLPEMFMKFPLENSSSSVTSTDEIIKQKKLILSNLFRDYLQTMSQTQVSSQITDKKNDTKSYTNFCSTSTNT